MLVRRVFRRGAFFEKFYLARGFFWIFYCLFYLSIEKLEPQQKIYFSHHKSFPERHELLQYFPRASQTSSQSHCCDSEERKEKSLWKRCSRYLAYSLGDWDEFASFEKEKLRDRRFPLPTFAFSPHSQPSQSYERNVNTLCVFTWCWDIFEFLCW